jgi:N-acetyl-anhydromuramyl-L-alanine amidase AmpD
MKKTLLTIALLLILSPIFVSAQAAPTSPSTSETPISAPKLNIPIPTLPSLSQATITKNEKGEPVSADIPWIAEYLLAIYKYALIIGSVFAVLMIMVGGFLYLSSGMNQSWAKKGKEIALGSLSGLVILLAAYAILYLINPELTNLKSLRLVMVQETEFDAAVFETKSFNAGKPSQSHVVCDMSGVAVNRATGKPVDQSVLVNIGNGANFSPNPHQKGIPFYETNDGIYTRNKQPDVIIIHATEGNSFLNDPGVSTSGGPAVHYLIDRNGDTVQLIMEENMAGSVKSGPISSQANARSISYEIVNLETICGSVGYQTKNRRYSGTAPSTITDKHPNCLKITAVTPTEVHKNCPCSTKPEALKDKKCHEEYPEEQLQAVAKITAWVAKRYNIPIKHSVSSNSPATNCPSWNMYGYCWDLSAGIIGHADIQDNTHGDPGPAFDWNHFLSLVNSYYASVPNTAQNAEAAFYQTFGGKPGQDVMPKASDKKGCCTLDNGDQYANITEVECLSYGAAINVLSNFVAGACP